MERVAPAEMLASGLVEFAGIRRRVCLACVPEAQPGDYVIVHAGIAISRIDADEAQRVFAYCKRPATATAGRRAMKYGRISRRPPCRTALGTHPRPVTRPGRSWKCAAGDAYLIRSGIDQRLPAPVRLVHGPGCPSA